MVMTNAPSVTAEVTGTGVQATATPWFW